MMALPGAGQQLVGDGTEGRKQMGRKHKPHKKPFTYTHIHTVYTYTINGDTFKRVSDALLTHLTHRCPTSSVFLDGWCQ